MAGGRVTNFTSGQGLILMKEVLYTISGKRLPIVFHIGARALTSHSLNVHAGHDDVVGVSDCGWGVLYARNAQEAGDFALIARRTAEEAETPFLNVQDGFLTTHTIENVRLPEPDLMKLFVGHPSLHIRNLMDPQIPLMSGVVQNQDSYMKGKIAQRRYYDRVLPMLKSGDARVSAELTGRRYDDGHDLSPGGRRLRHRGIGLHDRDCRGRGRLHARETGHQGGDAAPHVLPSVPLGGRGASAAARRRPSRCWSGWTSP